MDAASTNKHSHKIITNDEMRVLIVRVFAIGDRRKSWEPSAAFLKEKCGLPEGAAVQRRVFCRSWNSRSEAVRMAKPLAVAGGFGFPVRLVQRLVFNSTAS